MAGNLTRTLVVGGVASYVNETARKKLARWGLSVEWHVPMGKAKQENNPSADARCEAVVVFGDMVSNKAVTKAWAAFARERSIPCAIIDRHESHWPAQFDRQGFKTIPAVAAAAVAEPEEQPMAQQQPKAAPAPPSEYHDRLSFLKEALRELAEKDGVQSLSWDAKSGLVRVQREVRMVQEDVL
jgi:hypothetical protein